MASDFNNNQINKSFDYSLRVSNRAKNAKLRIKPYGGVEVIIPPRFPKKAVPGLVGRHTEWILRQLQNQQEYMPEPVLPEKIYLAINHSCTQVIYRSGRPDTKKADQLIVSNGSYQQSVDQLRKWLRQQAWELLPPILDKVSHGTGLGYKKIGIRSQKTRWGSCSSRGTISLNDQLLFVSLEHVEYLMIHELCHTRHMNHSAKFWALVGGHCANYQRHESALNRARGDIPGWILRDIYR